MTNDERRKDFFALMKNLTLIELEENENYGISAALFIYRERDDLSPIIGYLK